MAELKSCDSHHESLVSPLYVTSEIQNDALVLGEAMGADAEKSTTFLGDTGASYHIVHKREYFSALSPLPGPFTINQVQGTMAVTHWGTVMLEVDSAWGK